MAINLDHVTEQITVTDTATNASLTVQPKGTGAFNIAAGSSGVNISNVGTVTAITLTNNGGGSGGYTSFPSVSISAPTTAGGVQATATILVMQPISASVQSGGTGYTLNDVVSLVGGTPQTVAATFRVSAVSGGVVTAVVAVNFAPYSVLPTAPVSTTGGTGTGLTLTGLTYAVGGTFTITNAGSGYVEQPTVTFSGGGGSGAAAYATVGSGTTVRSLGASIETLVDTTTILHLRAKNTSGGNPTNTSAAFGLIPPQSNFGAPVMGFISGPYFSWGGTGAMSFSSNASNPAISGNSGSEQFRISHTASAVNYVQVTGAATGSAARISTQGSDSLVGLGISSKGGGDIFFQTNGSSNTGFIVKGSTTAVNYLQAAGNATGFGAVLSAQGSDTNIPLVLQPKGTGALQAQQTDSTATGGNARGANAVDWQTNRSSASHVASSLGSVLAGGLSGTASGAASFLGSGQTNLVSSTYAVCVGGIGNNSTGNSAFLGGGASNIASGYYCFVGSGQSNSTTSNSAVTTQSATMNGTTAVTLAASNANIKVGQLVTGTSITTFPATYVAAISGTSLTLSQAASGSSTSTLSFYTPHGVVVGGGNNQATGSYSFIGGGGDAGTAANRNVASGDWSVVGGGIKNTASGLASFVGGGGTYGVAIGNTASGLTSFIGAGFNNNNSSYGGVISGGASNQASSNFATVSGGSNNNANSSSGTVSGGTFGTTRSIIGNHIVPAHGSPIADVSGIVQTALLVLARQTTDATATVLTSNTSAAGTTNQVILPNNSAYYFRGEVVSGVTGGGNTKGWYIEGVIKRGANAASTALVGTPTVTSNYADAGASTWTIAVTADTTNGGLAVTFTGQASTTIRTVAQIRTTEMTF